ncbi:hypothetical protein M2271_003873 [Streptomyces sp. LBL]|nr:hypothetical protein [Streptomyces sp. LBL]
MRTGRQSRADRDDTFTDSLARRPDGRLLTHRLLSDAPERHSDVAVKGVRELLAGSPDPAEAVRRGTTVAGGDAADIRPGDVLLIEPPAAEATVRRHPPPPSSRRRDR